MQAFTTILPIFLLIALGWFAHHRGFIPQEFLGPANRLTYYFAIPALVFRAIAKASFVQEFHGGVLLATLGAAALAYLFTWCYCLVRRLPRGRIGSVVQSAGHGNLGYIGLPFAFYFLGDVGLVKAGIISGFLMILQNVLSVTALQAYSGIERQGTGLRSIFAKVLTNPVILSSLAGILVSASGLQLPLVILRAIDMLSGLAPPMALLLIGASISFRAIRAYARPVLFSVVAKLLLLPGIGLGIYTVLQLPASEYLPGLILLCCPTATVAYIMAREMGGDADFVVASISTSTLLSAGSFLLWLSLVGAS